MRKQPSKYWLLLIPAILLVIFVIWFWSLGNLKTGQDSKIQLVIEKGNVFITSKNSGLEKKASSGMDLQEGDALRTAQGAAASIMVFGKVDERMDENTTLVIEQAEIQGTSLIYNWRLENGRVWARVLRLLDLDSSFQGEADTVVATVRGTAFAFTKNASEVGLLVDHGSINTHVKDKDSANKINVTGDWAVFESSGRLMNQGEVASSTWQNDTWKNQNKEFDTKFVESASRNILQDSGINSGSKPDQWLYGLSKWSEDLHLVLAGKKASQLSAHYTGRRIAYVYDLIKRGKSGLAFQILSEVEKEVDVKKNAKNGKEYAMQLRPVVGNLLLAVSDAETNDMMYRLKIRLEDLYISTWEGEPAQVFYSRSLTVDSRLDEAERLECGQSPFENLIQAINAVEQGLAREENDFTSLRTTINEKYRLILQEKIISHDMRLERLRKKLELCKVVPEVIANFEDETATTTSDVLEDLQATTTQAVNENIPSDNIRPPIDRLENKPPANEVIEVPPVNMQDLGLMRVELYAQPNPINVGEASQLYVKGYKQDGSSIDVTNRADFKVIGNIGSVSGSTFTSNAAGSIIVEASVNDNGKTLVARVSLTINQRVELSRISISPNGGNIVLGQSQPMSVMAYYTNGFSSNVTSAVKWSLSNNIATISGSTLNANQDKLGQVTVTAQYTENSVTKSYYVDFQIVAGQFTTNVTDFQ